MSQEQKDQDVQLADASVAVDEVALQKEKDTEKAIAYSEASYKALRASIARHMTIALRSGSVLLQERAQNIAGHFISGPISFATWHNALPELAKQHYNCRACQNAWSTIGGLAVVSEKGEVTYPAITALLENMDNPIVRSIFDNSPNLLADLRDNMKLRSVQYMVIGGLSDSLAADTAGGFQHFYLASKEDIDKWNLKHKTFSDIKYAETLFHLFNEEGLNVDVLEKIFTYVKAEIGEKEHTALSRSDQLVEAIRVVRRVQAKSQLGFAYLWSLLSVVDNSWMKHVQGSVLSIVLDAYRKMRESPEQSMERALHNVKQLLQKATSADQYKQKTAEAPLGAVEATYKFLTDKELTGTLERRLVTLDDVTSVVWTPQVTEAPSIVPQKLPATAVQTALEKLRQEKDPVLKTNSALNDLLASPVSYEDISRTGFMALLGDIVEINIPASNAVLCPIFASGPVHADLDHDELFIFDRSMGKHISLIGLTQPVSYVECARMAVTPEAWELAKDNQLYRANDSIPVKAIALSNRLRADGEEGRPIFMVENLAVNFYSTLSVHGTAILGTTVKSEHFGHSRSLTELARQIPMDVSAGASAAGGFSAHKGMKLDVVFKDGKRVEYTIVSEI